MRLQKSMLLVAVVIMFTAGCDALAKARFIPKEKLTPQMEDSIAKAIQNEDHSRLRSYGKKAVPMLLETVLKNPASFDAGNFILDIGKSRDTRAVPALLHILSQIKYRISHKAVAMALADIQDKSAIGPLQKAFEREKGYIAAGKLKGPDYGWGLANDYAAQVARQHGLALQRLGVRVGDVPQDNMAKMHEEFKRMQRE